MGKAIAVRVMGQGGAGTDSVSGIACSLQLQSCFVSHLKLGLFTPLPICGSHLEGWAFIKASLWPNLTHMFYLHLCQKCIVIDHK